MSNNNESDNNKYMLFFRGTDWSKGLSPEQTQKVMSAWMSWFEGLMAKGKVTGGHPLEAEGKLVGKGGRVMDGPFAESKEAVGGYFMLAVDSFEEAVAIAKNCPGLDYGCTVEVRQVAGECGAARALREAEAAAVA